MENDELLKILKQDVGTWNKWREENPGIKPHFDYYADLTFTHLKGANLSGAHLSEAYLTYADLEGANLRDADLSGACLKGANLSGAFLRLACLIRTDLREAKLTGARLYGTARDEWIIEGIVCDFVYWDTVGEERTPKDRNFRPGEFEKRYKYLPTIFNHSEQSSIIDLINGGESSTLEFKSTLQWDVKLGQKNKELRNECLKTITAFLNSDGGTLIIGVEDDGAIFGLQPDLSLIEKKKNLDGFEQLLMCLIKEYIGSEVARFLNIYFEWMHGKDVCVIDVKKSNKPVLMKKKKQKIFYIRLGNTTVQIEHEKMLEYVQTHWK